MTTGQHCIVTKRMMMMMINSVSKEQNTTGHAVIGKGLKRWCDVAHFLLFNIIVTFNVAEH